MNNLSGCGADYCLYYSNSPISVWTQYVFERDGITYNGHIDLIKFYQPLFGKSSRMMFCFPNVPRIASYYDETKWETLLQLFNNRGQKVMAGMLPSWASNGYCASPQLQTDWLNFTQKWKGDTRMNAFQLYQEPIGERDNGQGTVKDWYHTVTTRKQLATYFVNLTREIHKIDSNRVVVYPMLGLSYFNQQDLINDFGAIASETGIDILSESNTIFDIIHPYLFQNQLWETYDFSEITARLKVHEYYGPMLEVWKNNIPSYKRFVGETFMFTKRCYETGWQIPKMNLQRAFWLEMVNSLVSYDTSFDVLGLIADPPHNIDQKYICVSGSSNLPYTDQTACINNGGSWVRYQEVSRSDEHKFIIQNSTFAPITNGNVKLPFYDNFINLDNWKIINGNWEVL